jgi:hypothetical protein
LSDDILELAKEEEEIKEEAGIKGGTLQATQPYRWLQRRGGERGIEHRLKGMIQRSARFVRGDAR